ncbi:MAG: ECF transporter S component [Christensenellales bacterium]|jgi:uncharacterized membrane protein
MNTVKTPQKDGFRAHALARYGLFTAIILILGLTPLGFITLPIASITMVHIPVIIGGQQFGSRGGMLLGFFFGLTSLIRMFITPTAVGAVVLGTYTGFGALNVALILLVTFLPRVLTGLFAALSFKLCCRFDKTRIAAYGISSFIGSMTNTVFFLGGLYVLAFEQTAQAFGVAGEGLMAALFGIVSLNGLLEAAVAVVLCTAVGKAMQAAARRGKNTNIQSKERQQ